MYCIFFIRSSNIYSLMKNCFYSDMENKACDDSFVLHIAVNTNVSEGFVFTAIQSTNQILCQIATSVVEFQAQEIGPDNFTSRHYRKYQYQDEHYETKIVLNSNVMIPNFPHIMEIRLLFDRKQGFARGLRNSFSSSSTILENF